MWIFADALPPGWTTIAFRGIAPAQDGGYRWHIGRRWPVPVVAVALSARPGSPPATSASPLTYLPGSGMFSRLMIGQALKVVGRSLEISSRLFTELRLQLDNPEVIVRPEVSQVGILDTPEAGPLIEAGRTAMAAGLRELDGWYGLRGAIRRVVPA